MKTSGPSFRNAEMFVLGGAVGFLIELVFRGERTCPKCPACNAGLIVPHEATLNPPQQAPR